MLKLLAFICGFQNGPASFKMIQPASKPLDSFEEACYLVEAGLVVGLLEQLVAIVNVNVRVTSILIMRHIY